MNVEKEKVFSLVNFNGDDHQTRLYRIKITINKLFFGLHFFPSTYATLLKEKKHPTKLPILPFNFNFVGETKLLLVDMFCLVS